MRCFLNNPIAHRDGKYASARSAGNYLAGYNGATHTMYGYTLSFNQYMGLAGALQTHDWDGHGRTVAIGIVGFGVRYGPAPYYGELPYTGRMVNRGFTYGEQKSYIMGGSSEATYAKQSLLSLGYKLDH